MSDPLKYYDNNLGGTICLLESMVAHGVDKIVFSSTAATYGEPGTDKTVPTNCYGETKLAMEKMMSWTSGPTACGMWPCGTSTPAAPIPPEPSARPTPLRPT